MRIIITEQQFSFIKEKKPLDVTQDYINDEISKAVGIIPKVPFKDVNTLSSSQNLKDFLKMEEGSSVKKGEPMLVAYKKLRDRWTIGFGHTNNVNPKMKIDKQTAIKFLENDIKEHENCIKRIFNQWKTKGIDVKITQAMFDTLVSLSFNAGCNSLRGDKIDNEVIDYVRRKDFYNASNRILYFNVLNSKSFPGLKSRREKESKMFCSQGGCDKKGAIKKY